MNSIEPAQEKALVAFYRENLVPLQHRLPSDTNAGSESYWRKREWRPLERKDFEIALGTADQAGASLDRFWAGTALEGLVCAAKQEVSPSSAKVGRFLIGL
jgi:hypothetical protein